MTESSAQLRGTAAATRGLYWAGFALGFALGGFADGILFHQVLQWHHLMSLVDLPAVATLEGQVVADGLFHVATYAIAMGGLYLLWRNRAAAYLPEAGRDLVATFLIGFGVWHIADNILVHWILEWHHIRLPPYNPILWDLVTFVIGLGFVAWGWSVWRRPPSTGGPGFRRGAAPMALALSVLIAGSIAALPQRGPLILAFEFGAETSRDEAFLALLALGGRIISEQRGPEPRPTHTWLVELKRAPEGRELQSSGAKLLGSVPLLTAGCFGGWWARADSST